MIFSTTFFINEGALFDFDLTFIFELLLFVLLSLIVTTKFISPISKEIDARAEFIDYTLYKSTILLTFGYERLIQCIDLLTTEINEMNRQVKLTRNFANSKFEYEVEIAQGKNIKILNKLKGNLAIKSAFLFANINKDLEVITNKFFTDKFK